MFIMKLRIFINLRTILRKIIEIILRMAVILNERLVLAVVNL
jgi:hypothetical protein